MRAKWGRQRRIGILAYLTALGVTAAITGVIVGALATRGTTLQDLANISQVFGVLLSIGSTLVLVVNYLVRRLSPEPPVSDWPTELAAKIAASEERNRRSLLAGPHAADVTISSSFVPDSLEGWLEEGCSGKRFKLSGLDSHYRSLGPNGRLVLVGEPGSGKTVAAIQLIVRMLADRDSGDPIPVRFSLAGWNPAFTADEWFTDRLARDYRIPSAFAESLVEQRRILPVLDGLDEMDADVEDVPARRAIEVVDWLNRQHTAGGLLAGAVVTCRARRYQQLAELGKTIHQAHVVHLLKLEPDQIAAYVGVVFGYQKSQLVHWQGILEDLRRPSAAPILNVIATPWRLTLAIMLVQAGASPAEIFSQNLGESAEDAAERIQHRLISEFVSAATHVADEGSYSAKYSADEVEHFMRRLAGLLQRNSSVDSSATAADIDIVPYKLFEASRLPRIIHAATSAVFMAVGCVILALNGIGSPQIWAAEVARFVDEPDVLRGFFQDVVPVVVLIALPVVAASLAFSQSPAPVPRASRQGRFGGRVRKNMRLTLSGAFVAILLFWAEYLFGSIGGLIRKIFGVYSLVPYWDIVLFVFTILLAASCAQFYKTCAMRSAFAVVLTLVMVPNAIRKIASVRQIFVGHGWWAATALIVEAISFAALFSALCVLVARHCTSLAEEIIDRLQISHSREFVGLIFAVVIPTCAGWLLWNIGGQKIFVEYGYGSFGFNPVSFVGYGLAAGVVAGVTSIFARALGGSLFVGTTTGLLVGFAAGLELPINPIVARWILPAMICGGAIVAGLLVGLVYRDPEPIGHERRLPQAALHDDLVSSLWTAAAIGVPIVIFLITGAGAAFGLHKVDAAGAVVFALICALVFGPLGRRSWIRFRIGSALAAARGDLPFTLGRFLDWASGAGMLRVNGSAYQFRHLELQRWLVDRGAGTGHEESSGRRVIP